MRHAPVRQSIVIDFARGYRASAPPRPVGLGTKFVLTFTPSSPQMDVDLGQIKQYIMAVRAHIKQTAPGMITDLRQNTEQRNNLLKYIEYFCNTGRYDFFTYDFDDISDLLFIEQLRRVFKYVEADWGIHRPPTFDNLLNRHENNTALRTENVNYMRKLLSYEFRVHEVPDIDSDPPAGPEGDVTPDDEVLSIPGVKPYGPRALPAVHKPRPVWPHGRA